MENGKQVAFANQIYKEFADDFENGFKVNKGVNPTGLTKREYFAAKSMQGLLSAMSGLDNSQFLPNLDNTKYCADLAVSAADELLRALAKTEC